jgi:hypothetical protein
VNVNVEPSNAPVDAEQGPERQPDAGTNAWVLLFVDALLVFSGSLFWLVHGHFFDTRTFERIGGGAWNVSATWLPGMERLVAAVVRLLGVMGLAFAVLAMTVAATSFRRGERWSWYALSLLAVLPVADMVVFASYDALTSLTAAWDVFLLVIALGGLFIPRRSAFTSPSESQA